jgi:DNA uptake protein ComE-like DNA-binding protein
MNLFTQGYSTQNYVKQVVSFQKSAFENSFAVADILQGQAERMFTLSTGWLPEESRLLIEHWLGFMQEGRRNFQNIVIENLNRLEDLAAEVPAPKAPMEALPKLNEVSKQELESITGIGEVTADKITQYLNKKGASKSWEDLQSHAGLTDALLSKLKKSYAL